MAIELEKKGGDETHVDAAARFNRLLSKRDSSIIHDLFGGLFKANVTCGSCHYSTCTYERFCLLCLTLPTPLVRMIQVLVFPLPRGSAPITLHVGLPSGARATDVAEYVAKAIRTKKEHIILVFQDRAGRAPTRDGGNSYAVLETNVFVENLFERHRQSQGDVNNLPSMLLAYEDRMPAYYAADEREDNSNCIQESGQYFKSYEWMTEGDQGSLGSPFWKCRNGNDIRYIDDLRHGGTMQSSASIPFIVELGDVEGLECVSDGIDEGSILDHNRRRYYFPIVFRCPRNATIGQVRRLLIHALMTMARSAAWSTDCRVNDALPVVPFLTPPDTDGQRQFREWFEKLHTIPDDVTDPVHQKALEWSHRKFEHHFDIPPESQDLAQVKLWRSPFNQDIASENHAAFTASWERRRLEQVNYDRLHEEGLPATHPGAIDGLLVDPQHESNTKAAETLWKMEASLISALGITGPGATTQVIIPCGSSSDSKDQRQMVYKYYKSKFRDEAYILSRAVLKIEHLGRNINDFRDHRFPNPELEDTFNERLEVTKTAQIQFQTAMDYYRTFEPSSDTIDKYTAINGLDSDARTAVAMREPIAYDFYEPGDQFELREIDCPTQRHALSQPIDFFDAANAMVADKKWFRQDRPPPRLKNDVHILAARAHYRLHIGELVDTLDLYKASKDPAVPTLCRYVTPAQLNAYEQLTERIPTCHADLRAPIWTVHKILSQNPRALVRPIINTNQLLHLTSLIDEDQTEEFLFDEDAWKCEKCHKRTQSSKNHTVWSTGEYILINLKRFSFMAGSGVSRKNQLAFQYPEDGIVDLSKFIEDPDQKEKRYEIFGAVVHRGSLEFGHYLSLVKGDASKGHPEWFKIDDENVLAVNLEQLQHEMTDAYILALRKLNLRPTFNRLVLPPEFAQAETSQALVKVEDPDQYHNDDEPMLSAESPPMPNSPVNEDDRMDGANSDKRGSNQAWPRGRIQSNGNVYLNAAYRVDKNGEHEQGVEEQAEMAMNGCAGSNPRNKNQSRRAHRVTHDDGVLPKHQIVVGPNSHHDGLPVVGYEDSES